ncbi:MAG: hypothetical protein WB947_06195 [Thermoplasmata archaeon]
MSAFRGSDEALDREIATLERIARLRVRRAAVELRGLERDLRELRRERARRQAASSEATPVVVDEAVVS